MMERWRFYLAGAFQATGVLCVAGWAASHWVAALGPFFGPTGWLPVPVGLCLLLLGIPLARGGSRRPGPRHAEPGAAAAAGGG